MANPFHTTVLGIIAGVLSSTAFVPQVVRTYTSRTASTLAWSTLGVSVASEVLWLVYGFLNDDKISIAVSSFQLVLYILLGASKILPSFKKGSSQKSSS